MKTTNLIPWDVKRIGVMVSGGLDSATLLHFLVKENKTKLDPVEIVVCTVPRYDAAVIHSKRIIEFIENFHNVKLTQVDVGTSDVHSDMQVIEGARDAILRLRFRCVFLATTAIPEHLAEGFGAPQRDASPKPLLEQPWGLVTKDQVVKALKDEGLEELIRITHSCTVHQMEHCGQCFNCVERKWALDSNVLIDNTEF